MVRCSAILHYVLILQFIHPSLCSYLFRCYPSFFHYPSTEHLSFQYAIDIDVNQKGFYFQQPLATAQSVLCLIFLLHFACSSEKAINFT